MKIPVYACLVLLAVAALFCQKTSAQVPHAVARLTHATVFANRAQLFSTVKTTVEAGTTELIIDHIADQLDPQSIQLSGKGDVVIQGVSFNQNFLQNPPKSPVVRRLEDSLKIYKDQLADLASARDVIQQEKDLLLANRQVGGPQGGATIEKIEQLTAYFRRRITDINAQLRANSERQVPVTERINRIQNQLNALGQRRAQPTGELRVTVQSPRRTPVELELNYVALDASWTPTYDLRAAGTGPIQLVYRASVVQNTGLEWENIRLTLSSANPSLSGEAPELDPRFVDFYQPRPMPVMAPAQQSKRGDYSGQTDEERAASFGRVRQVADDVQVGDNALTVSFEIPVPYTIPSGDNAKVVDIQRFELPARYRHLAIPKREAAAFLQAELNGWEKLNLLRGRASVFFEGTYVGNTELNPQNPDDTLRISLGRDRRVLVKLEDVRSEAARSGSGERETRAYRITVRNTKPEPVDLTVDDQVPLSRNNQITVDDVQAPGAERDEATGRLRWQLALKPGESRTLDFRYTVRHPKGKPVVGL